MAEIKIDRVVLKIGNKDVSLSIKEARELKDILNETFKGKNDEKEKEYIYIPSLPSYIPYPVPTPYTHPPYYTITWQTAISDNGTLTLSNGTQQADFGNFGDTINSY